MPVIGEFHDELDVKMIVLYILSRAVEPVGFFRLVDLAMCDPCVNYFMLTTALVSLEETGQIAKDLDDRYAITEKGRRNSAICESSLPFAVRQKCDRNVRKLNRAVAREAQVKAETVVREDGSCAARMSLGDNLSNLITLEMTAASEEDADRLCARFMERPDEVYDRILQVLLTDGKEKEP